MKTEKRSDAAERRILIGVVVDDAVCGKVASVWDDHLFRSPWSNLVGGWAVNFYREQGVAPGKSIIALFESWADESQDKKTVEVVESFLSGLSAEYESHKKEVKPNHLIQQASEYFNKIRMIRFHEQLAEYAAANQLDKAFAAVNDFGRVQMGRGTGVDVLRDDEFLKRIFKKEKDDLFAYPDAAGVFFARSLVAGRFLAFQGIEKGKKSWMVEDMAWRAMLHRLQVAYFQVGDLDEADVGERFLIRAAKRPFRPTTLRIPDFMEFTKKDKIAYVDYKERIVKGSLDIQEARLALDEVAKKTKSKRKLLNLDCYPPRGISVNGIREVLKGWERNDDWFADVICVDMADWLDPPVKRKEAREEINDTWLGLRKISQETGALVVTVTQAKATAYKDIKYMTREHFADSKIKLGHVSGMIGLIANEEEYEREVVRMNWIENRHVKWPASKCLNVAGCLDIGNPIILSCW